MTTTVPWAVVEDVCRGACSAGVVPGAISRFVEALKVAARDGVAVVEVPADLGAALGTVVEGIDLPWLSRMVAMKYLGPEEVRAARDIQRAVAALRAGGTANIPAMDLTKLRVDGGRPPQAHSHGVGLPDEVARFARWRSEVAQLEPFQTRLRGTNAVLDVVDLVQRVLVDGQGPRAIDTECGLRNGRCGEAVRRELKRYARVNFAP